MLRPFLFASLLCCSVPALAIYKCEAGGKMTYSDSPCAGGKVLDIDGAPAADAQRAAEQAARDKKTLKRLEDQQRKQTAKDKQALQRSAKAEANRQKKCTSLERRQRWAAEDAAHATGKSAERAKQKARRAVEAYEDACKQTELTVMH